MSTATQTEQSKFAEASAQAVVWQKESLALGPLVAAVIAQAAVAERERLALFETLRPLPDWAKRWFGSHSLETYATRFRQTVTAYLSNIFPTVYSTRVDDFAATVAHEIFADLHESLATLAATNSGGGGGRKLFRARTNVSGLGGALKISPGEVVALLDSTETRKLVEAGALELFTQEGKK